MPVDYYTNLAKQLTGAVAEGLGGTSFEAGDYRNTLKAYFDQNVYAFSMAKSFTVMQEYNRLLLDDKGEIVPLGEFKRRVLGIDEKYNKTYLEAEYNNAIASAQMAEAWQGLKAFKMLEYRTVGDDRVRPQHAVLDKLIRPSTDPIWNTIYPPNAWNCRCTVVPAADTAEATPPDHAHDLQKAADIKPYFKTNVAKEQVIYRDGHPYFKNLRNGKMRELDAEKNYGMRSVQKIYAAADLPTYTQLMDKEAANDWWTAKAGSLRNSFDVAAKDGLSVQFDNQYRVHVLEQNDDKRYRFMHLTEDVLKAPDEIWSNKVKGVVQQVYIKYYDKFPVMMAVNTTETVNGITIYEVQKGGKINFDAVKNMRKGILKYKK